MGRERGTMSATMLRKVGLRTGSLARKARCARSTRMSATRTTTRALFGGGAPKLSVPAIKDIKLKDIDNRSIDPSQYVGKVLLVTNVASNCGFTASNYKDLVELYDKYRGDDFEILAFPCNQFGNQEPGSNEQIKSFTRRYGVEFPVTEKADVNGPKAHPFSSTSRRRVPSPFLGLTQSGISKSSSWTRRATS